VLGTLQDRFGIKESVFEDYLLLRRHKGWRIIKKSSPLERASYLKVSMVGIHAFDQVGAFIKPTTRFVQIFGSLAKRAVYHPDRGEWERLLSGDTLSFEEPLENGYVFLFLNRKPVGLGLLINSRIRSQIPKKAIPYFSITTGS
jgi:NOL1/NOP2/fmu family ribosome biogenesis protein